MTTQWSVDQVLALSPDGGSTKAATKLTAIQAWALLGCNADAIWGECQGSGKLPYQTQIDLNDVSFKCSCPSRKFPCKHALALFLLFVQKQEAFTSADAPTWVSGWLESRSKRAQAKAERPMPAKATDDANQAKRAAAREAKVQKGLQELSLWLQDIIRAGMTNLQGKPPSFFEGMAARLVDTQAPGAAGLVRDLTGLSLGRADWPEQMLEKLAQLHLLVEAHERLHTLPETIQEDIRTAIGWTRNQADLLQSPGTPDTWQVLGQVTENDDRLRVRRTWLQGLTSRQHALLLEFAHGSLPFPNTLVMRTQFEGELVYYPSNYPLRALIKDQAKACDITTLHGHANHAEALDAYAEALAQSPWLAPFPMLLMAVLPTRTAAGWALRDTHNKLLNLSGPMQEGWQLLAVSGGHPIHVFGEWNGTALRPLTVRHADGWLLLGDGA